MIRLGSREKWVVAAVGALAVGVLVAMIVITSGGGPTIVQSTETAPRPAPARPAPALPAPQPLLFAPGSVWNARVDGDQRLMKDSDAMVAHLSREARAAYKQGIGPSITWRRYSTPLYTVPADQPTVRVALDGGQYPFRRELQAAFKSVPLPDDARQAPGRDAHLTIWQPSTDKL